MSLPPISGCPHRDLMSRTPIDQCQARLFSFAKSVCGEAGIEWLDSLPSLVEKAASEWKLTDIKPLNESTMSFVALCLANGERAVLKIGLPWKESLTEMRALRAFSGSQSVGVLQVNEDLRMTLMERAEGPSMWELWTPEKEEELTQQAAEFIAQFKHPSHAVGEFHTLEDWAKAYDRFRTSPSSSNESLLRLVDEAESVFAALLPNAADRMLLHGDLHHGNILKHGKGWIAIDPKAVWGERAYEPSWFIRNPAGVTELSNLESVLTRRIETFSSALKIDRDRIAHYAFANQVLSMAWDLEDSGSTSDDQFRLATALKHVSS